MATRSLKITIVISAILLIGTLAGLFISAPPAPNTTATKSLTVMTYNIYQGYTPAGKPNLEVIRDTIRSVDPDIVGLEESDMDRISSMNVDSIKWLATQLNMYSYLGPPTSEQIIGVSLLSKYPITRATYHLLSYDELPRVLIEATLQIGSTEVTVFVVHMGLPHDERVTQASEIIQYVNAASSPKILMGDFNTLPTGEPEPDSEDPRHDHIYANISLYLNDTWTAAGHPLNDASGFTWPSDNPVERIDYIWVSPDISVTSCTVITSAAGSDHLPVAASIQIP